MWVDELTVVVNFSSKVRVVFRGGFEYDFGAVCQGMSSKVDFAKGALANDTAKGVVADMSQFGRTKFSGMISMDD